MSTIRSSILYSKLAALVVVLLFGVSDAIAEEAGGWDPEVVWEEVVGGWDPSEYVSSMIEPEVDENEVQCLAKNIYHEARHEPREGKLAVAQVTLNRVNHDAFAPTVCGVVHQKTRSARTNRLVCQFSWVCDKRVKKNVIKSPDEWQESLEIARQAIVEGVALTSMKNALFYHANYVNPGWNLQRIKRIGAHIFYSEKRKK